MSDKPFPYYDQSDDEIQYRRPHTQNIQPHSGLQYDPYEVACFKIQCRCCMVMFLPGRWGVWGDKYFLCNECYTDLGGYKFLEEWAAKVTRKSHA